VRREEDPEEPQCLYILGAHALEILEDHSILLMEIAAIEQTMTLDEEESYRLCIALQAYFQEAEALRVKQARAREDSISSTEQQRLNEATCSWEAKPVRSGAIPRGESRGEERA
jgi:hypothetical protein